MSSGDSSFKQLLRLTFWVGLAGLVLSPLARGLGSPIFFWLIASLSLALLALNLFFRRADLKLWLSRRRTRKGFDESIRTLFVLALILAVYLLFYFDLFHFQKDWTAEKRNSLHPKTVETLKKLPFTVTAEIYDIKRNADKIQETLRLMSLESPRFQFRRVDLLRDPALAREKGVDREGTLLLIRSNEPPLRLSRGEMVKTLYDEAGEPRDEVLAEEKIISALLALMEPKVVHAYFLAGSGEKKIDDQGETGLSRLRSSLELSRIACASWDPGVEPLPSDADLLVVAGPKAMKASAPALMNELLSRGGAAMFFLDPIFDQGGRASGWENFLEVAGLHMENDLIVDPSDYLARVGSARGSPLYPILNYASDPVTEDLKKRRYDTVFFSARSLRPLNENWKILLSTGPKAWGLTELLPGKQLRVDPKKDHPGPLVLGAVERSPFRLAVFGDSDFARNPLLEVAGHRDLLVNAARSLVGREPVFVLDRSRESGRTFILSESEKTYTSFFFLAIFPLAILIFGFLRMRIRSRSKPAPSPK
ncbi:MAG: Gldg family protein [Spirochaetia bacterium]|nr:Gldg family protein [Spirochaetia bacterium]